MNHILFCTDLEGNDTTIVYDNNSNTLAVQNISLEDLERINYLSEEVLKFETKIPSISLKVSPETPINKFNNIKFLKILLGFDCNYNCSYCKQASYRKKQGETFSQKDVDIFLELLQENISSCPEKIEFWGGEPLLYWETIKYLTPKIFELYPETRLSIITNGALLTEEILDWVIDNNVSVVISHDGPGQYLRGPDPIENEEILKIWKLFIEARSQDGNLSFNAVITPENNDIKKIIEWFIDRLGNEVLVNFEGIVNIDDNDHISKFSEDQYNQMKKSIYDIIVNGNLQSVPVISERFRDFYTSLLMNIDSNYLGQKCGMDRPDSLAVDLFGNVMTCHNVGAIGKHKIGHISDLKQVKLNTGYHWSYREKCKDCLVLHICKGSCMYLTGDDFEETCQNEFHYALPILFGVIWAITGKTVIGYQNI